jgi:hypothetical protein
VVDLLEVDDYDLLVIHNYELVVHLHNWSFNLFP